MIQRMVRAARLDGTLFGELQESPTATVEALGVVLISGLSVGVGVAVRFFRDAGMGPQAMVLTQSVTSAIAAWAALGLLAYAVGRLLLRRPVAFPFLLRAVGFANAPGIFYFLILLGGNVEVGINVALFVWAVLALMVALRHALAVSLLGGFLLSTAGVFITLAIRRLLT